jgi:hypothetical protein
MLKRKTQDAPAGSRSPSYGACRKLPERELIRTVRDLVRPRARANGRGMMILSKDYPSRNVAVLSQDGLCSISFIRAREQ